MGGTAIFPTGARRCFGAARPAQDLPIPNLEARPSCRLTPRTGNGSPTGKLIRASGDKFRSGGHPLPKIDFVRDGTGAFLIGRGIGGALSAVYRADGLVAALRGGQIFTLA